MEKLRSEERVAIERVASVVQDLDLLHVRVDNHLRNSLLGQHQPDKLHAIAGSIGRPNIDGSLVAQCILRNCAVF